MKKRILTLLLCSFLMGVLASCGGNKNSDSIDIGDKVSSVTLNINNEDHVVNNNSDAFELCDLLSKCNLSFDYEKSAKFDFSSEVKYEYKNYYLPDKEDLFTGTEEYIREKSLTQYNCGQKRDTLPADLYAFSYYYSNNNSGSLELDDDYDKGGKIDSYYTYNTIDETSDYYLSNYDSPQHLYNIHYNNTIKNHDFSGNGTYCVNEFDVGGAAYDLIDYLMEYELDDLYAYVPVMDITYGSVRIFNEETHIYENKYVNDLINIEFTLTDKYLIIEKDLNYSPRLYEDFYHGEFIIDESLTFEEYCKQMNYHENMTIYINYNDNFKVEYYSYDQSYNKTYTMAYDKTSYVPEKYYGQEAKSSSYFSTTSEYSICDFSDKDIKNFMNTIDKKIK